MDTGTETAIETQTGVTLLTSPWFFAVVGGFIILGIVIFIAARRARQRTRLEQAQGELGARRMYNKDDTDNERV